MDIIVTKIITYLQKCFYRSSYCVEFKMPEDKGVNHMLYNVRNIMLSWIVNDNMKFNPNDINFMYLAVFSLVYNKYECEYDDVVNLYNLVPDLFKQYYRYTFDQDKIRKIVEYCHAIMKDVEITPEQRKERVCLYSSSIHSFKGIEKVRRYLQMCLKEKTIIEYEGPDDDDYNNDDDDYNDGEYDFKAAVYRSMFERFLINIYNELKNTEFNEQKLYQCWFAFKHLVMFKYQSANNDMFYVCKEVFKKCMPPDTPRQKYVEHYKYINHFEAIILKDAMIPYDATYYDVDDIPYDFAIF